MESVRVPPCNVVPMGLTSSSQFHRIMVNFIAFQVLHECGDNRETGETPVRSRHCDQRLYRIDITVRDRMGRRR